MLQPVRERAAQEHTFKCKGDNLIIKLRTCVVRHMCVCVWGVVQECALSLPCGWHVPQQHSPKDTAGGRAVLAACLHPSHALKPKWRAIRSILSTWGCRRGQRVRLSTFPLAASYPLMISLHSARMKCSVSGVRMHSAFFWPVLDSPSMTSEHWFMLIVPWGKVVGCRRHGRDAPQC